jgi:hypothetical protein
MNPCRGQGLSEKCVLRNARESRLKVQCLGGPVCQTTTYPSHLRQLHSVVLLHISEVDARRVKLVRVLPLSSVQVVDEGEFDQGGKNERCARAHPHVDGLHKNSVDYQ